MCNEIFGVKRESYNSRWDNNQNNEIFAGLI